MKELKKSVILKTKSGKEVTILEKIGEGGQGTVYKIDYDGQLKALKWYHPNKIKDIKHFRLNLENNIKKGAPTDSFLWPIDITEKKYNSFGYIMDLRPKEYKEFSDFLLNKINFSNIFSMVETGCEIIKGFRELHRNGYSYQDLNDGNFFINPNNGKVLICDNDNVAEYGKNLGIAGKCRYMAPEIVTGGKPNIHSDEFSMAVILFLLLFFNHPLEGEKSICPCLTEDAEKKIYGTDPIFIYDEHNANNRPNPRIHRNVIKFWNVYPQFIRDLFIKSFSNELLLESPANRIMDKLWLEAFISLRDSIVKCDCGELTFYDTDKSENKCMNCGKTLPKYSVLFIKNKYKIIIAPNQKIYKCHLSQDYDYLTVYGRIATKKILNKDNTYKIKYGITNNSNTVWEAENQKGEKIELKSEDTVPALKGLKIKIENNIIGEIK